MEKYFKSRQEIQNIEDIVNDYFEEYGITNLDDYGEDRDSYNMPTLSQLYEEILDKLGIDYYNISTESVSDGKYTTNVEFENGNSINIDTNSSNTSKEITENVKSIKQYVWEQENEETDDMEM
ncbi:MAG: hypothetical protein Q4G05_00245 [Clostridia bacterium]|nr:hypothetical protein [Clostridia bacterium]